MSKASKGNSTFFDQERSIFVGGLHSKVTEEILWELFLQAGPLENVRIPKDKDTGKQRTFGFIVYQDACSVLFACELFDSLKLFGRPISCKPQNSQKRSPNSPDIERTSYVNNSPRSNEEQSFHNDDRRRTRIDESQSIRDQNSYNNRHRNHSNHQMHRSISTGPAMPLVNPLLAQKLLNQHLQNQLVHGRPQQSYGPIRRHNSLYERNPATSRMHRRQQTHPY